MKKRLLALTLAISMLMAGCSGQDTSSADNGTSGTTEITSSVPESSTDEAESKESQQETSAPETTTTEKAPETTTTEVPETTTTKAPETTTTVAPETTTSAKAPETEAPAPVDTKYIALTFDDGPNTTTTNQILDLLEKYNAKATFFLIGDNIND